MDPVVEWLRLTGAADDARWLPGANSDVRDAWRSCPDGRWMLSYMAEAGLSHRKLVAATCACLRLVADFLREVNPSWLELLHAAERYSRGEGTDHDLERWLDETEAGERLRRRAMTFGEPRNTRDAGRGAEAYAAMPALMRPGFLRVIRPTTSKGELARITSTLLTQLASLSGLLARQTAQAGAEASLDAFASSAPERDFSVAAGRAILARAGSSAYDEAAARAFHYALRRCAETIRRAVPDPSLEN